MITSQMGKWRLLSAGLIAMATIALPTVADPGKDKPSSNHGSLISKATRVPLEANDGKYYDKGGVDRPWLSDHEILHFTSHGQLFRYDITTKTDTPLSALTHQVATSSAVIYFLDASPDGQSVIWGMSGNDPYFVAPMDGSRRLQWPGNQGLTGSYWCADSHHWVEFQFNGTPEKLRWTHILVHNIDTPDQSETISAIPAGLQGLDILAAVSPDLIIARTHDHVTYGTSKPTYSREGNASFEISEKITYRKKQEISVWSLHQPQALHQWTINLPGYVSEVEVSPQGDRLVWLLKSSPSDSVVRNPESLWISAIDGSQLHKIGSVAAGDMPLELRWLPSGNQISFLYEGATWVVPVK